MEKNLQFLLLGWAGKNLRKFPWRKKRISAYRILVAEMLLKRTTAKAASRLYPKFIKKYPDIVKLSKAKESDVVEMVRPLGYFKRAKEILTIARFVIKHCNLLIPADSESLLEIPFVGHYTSNAIISLAFGKPAPMVDSNVNRILNRIYFGRNPPGNINKEITRIANKLLPRKYHRIFNLAMLDLGGTICLPKNPKCNICPLQTVCKFKKIVLQRKKK